MATASDGPVDHGPSACPRPSFRDVVGLVSVLVILGLMACGPGLKMAISISGSPARGVVTRVEPIGTLDLRYAFEGRRGTRPNAIAFVTFRDVRGNRRVGRLPHRRGHGRDPYAEGTAVAVRYVPFFLADRVVVDRSPAGAAGGIDWRMAGAVAAATCLALAMRAAGIRRLPWWRAG